jgi:predicted MFS family arabinose efflux permease
MAAGGLGALTGTLPIEMLLRLTDWRGVFLVFAVAIAIGSAIIYFVVPRRGVGGADASLSMQIKGFVNVFRSPLFRRVAPLAMASQGAFLGVQSLWSGPWLRDVGGLDRLAVANNLLLIAVAMIGGYVATGTLAERFGRRGIKTIHVALVGILGFQAVQLVLALQWTAFVTPLWMLFGFFGTSNALCYTALSQSFPAQLAGRVNAGLNLLVFFAAFGVQWGIGAVINLWPPTAVGGYAPIGYQAAFAAILVLQAMAVAWYGLYRDDTIRV